MIRVLTAAGIEDFDEADAYSIGPANPPQQPAATNAFVVSASHFVVPFETLPGALKLWRVDPSGGDDDTLIALFSPTGWVALDFRGEPDPPSQIAEKIGFQPPRNEEVPEP